MPRIAGLTGWERHAVPGEAGGGRDHLDERESTQPFVDVQVPGERARHRHRTDPAVEGLDGGGEAHLDRFEARARPVHGQSPARGVDEEVEHHLLAGRGAGQQEPTSGQAGQTRLGDRRREAGGHYRVERVAARPQRTGGGLGDRRVTGGDATRHSFRYRSAKVIAPSTPGSGLGSPLTFSLAMLAWRS